MKEVLILFEEIFDLKINFHKSMLFNEVTHMPLIKNAFGITLLYHWMCIIVQPYAVALLFSIHDIDF